MASQPPDDKVLSVAKDSLLRLAKALAPERLSLFDFVRLSWEILEPKKPFIDNWHIGLLCEHLEAVSLGQTRKLIINIPTRWSKSTLVTICFPTWEWGPMGKPEMRYMFVSYDQGLSTDHSLARRAILESDWYKEKWGGRVLISSDQNQKTFLQNTRRGKMIATSTHGGATGKGGDRLIFDDLLNPRMAESDAEREAGLRQYEATFSSRLDDKVNGAMIVVEQRLHARDFTAKLLAEGGWEHVCIPTDNYKKEPMTFIFPSSKREVTVEPGAAIWPEREPMEVIIDDRKRKGSRVHDAQCRQIPSAETGNIFKRHFWRFYDEGEIWKQSGDGRRVLTTFEDVIQSWDAAFKDSSTSDYVVGQVWGRRGADRYLLDQVRDRLDLPATIAAIISLTEKWPQAHRKLIEDKANGPAIMQMLAKKIPGMIAVNPLGGKVVRARAVSPLQEAGNIFLPNAQLAPWINDFIERFANFPEVDFDDEVDAMSQANIFFTSNSSDSWRPVR